MSSSASRLTARRAVEALRAGVPSAAVVDALGAGQPALERRLREALAQTREHAAAERQAPGFVIKGDFGSGKSHVLTAFEHMALAEDFAVARITVSKETALFDPAKVVQAVGESLRTPSEVDRGVEPVGRRLLRHRDGDAMRTLADAVADPARFNGRFAASLEVYGQGFQDQELADRVTRFWSGDKLNATDVRPALRELGRRPPQIGAIKAKDLARQRMSFLPLLCRAAGLGGLVLLIDEAELVGRYSKLQRANAYSELARWLGGAEDDTRPGLLTVAAITTDFDREVLTGKRDLDELAFYMAGRDPGVAANLQRGMSAIRAADQLGAPSDDTLTRVYETLKGLHAVAYAWDPPDVPWPERLGTNPMRRYVRAWINAWDLARLDPGFTATDSSTYVIAAEQAPDYREDPAGAESGPADEGDTGDDW